MRRLLTVGLVLVPTAALVSTAFGGAVNEQVEMLKAVGKPVVIAVDHGEFSCSSSCEPAFKIKADGSPHKVTGHAGYDAVLATVRSPTAVEVVEQRNGQNVAFWVYSVGKDGKWLHVSWADHSEPTKTRGGYSARRVAPAPTGAHAVSGSWQIEELIPEKAGEAKTSAEEKQGDSHPH